MKTSIRVVMIKPYGVAFEKAAERLRAEGEVEVVECAASTDAMALIQPGGLYLLLCHATDPAEIQASFHLLRSVTPAMREKRVRMLLTLGFSDPSLQKKLEFQGCSEVLVEPIPLKSLLFKIERHLKALPHQEETASFRFSAAQFGPPGGIWEEVETDGAQTLRAFVFIPAELVKTGDRRPVLDTQRFDGFWTYFGTEEPRLSTSDPKEWIFLGRKPQPAPSFDSLSPPLRQFLNRYFSWSSRGGSEVGAENAVNPVAFALMASELLLHRKYSAKEKAEKACRYLQSSLKGVRVRLRVAGSEGAGAKGELRLPVSAMAGSSSQPRWEIVLQSEEADQLSTQLPEPTLQALSVALRGILEQLAA